MINLFLSVALISSMITAPYPLPSIATETLQEDLQMLTGELRRICQCESGLRQYGSDGKVLRGVVNPDDVGICQINLKYHQKKALELGEDLFTEAGNIRYAQWLYRQEGSRPWSWSRGCWGSE